MAESSATPNVPTFKLVLVGDGGTGKVSILVRNVGAFLVLAVVTMEPNMEPY